MRLRLGRRLVDLLPVVQRTKTFANGVDGRTWVVGREFETHLHHENRFLKKSEFPHVKNLKNASGSPEIVPACGDASTRKIRSVPRGGECYEA